MYCFRDDLYTSVSLDYIDIFNEHGANRKISAGIIPVTFYTAVF